MYALGVILYEALAGWRPFRGEHTAAVLDQHLKAAPGRPAGMPEPLWQVLTGCLSKDPAARPRTATLVQDLFTLARDLDTEACLPACPPPPSTLPTQLKGARPGVRAEDPAAGRSSTAASRYRLPALLGAGLILAGLLGAVAHAVPRGTWPGGSVAAGADDAGRGRPEPASASSEEAGTGVASARGQGTDVVGEAVGTGRDEVAAAPAERGAGQAGITPNDGADAVVVDESSTMEPAGPVTGQRGARSSGPGEPPKVPPPMGDRRSVAQGGAGQSTVAPPSSQPRAAEQEAQRRAAEQEAQRRADLQREKTPPAPVVRLRGDVTGDGQVDCSDVAAVKQAWDWGNGDRTGSAADLNGDKSVNVIDLSIVLSNFDGAEQTC